MSNEDFEKKFEKKMEFIINQQAQFASELGQVGDIVARLAQGTLDRFEATDKRLDDVDERLSILVDAQIRQEENLKRTEEIVKETTESLRNLIAVVDRYFSEGRNGKSEE